MRRPTKKAPAFTGGAWSGPLAAQKAPRDKAAEKNKDVLKEREVISGWLRNGEPGGVAGLAKVGLYKCVCGTTVQNFLLSDKLNPVRPIA
jgi:hypothetical protein